MIFLWRIIQKNFFKPWRLFIFILKLCCAFIKGVILGGTKALEECFYHHIHINKQALYDYRLWFNNFHGISKEDQLAIKNRIGIMRHKVLFSILLCPDYKNEKKLHHKLDSIFRQFYSHWELLIVCDAALEKKIRLILSNYKNHAFIVKIIVTPEKSSRYYKWNELLSHASGKYIVFFDYFGELSEHALFLFAEEFNKYPETKIMYSDEDILDRQSKLFGPSFKPDWNPDLFISQNYLGSFLLYDKELVEKIGLFRAGFEGSELYDLTLRAIENIDEKNIRHIPHILFHKFFDSEEPLTKPASNPPTLSDKGDSSLDASKKALCEHFQRRGVSSEVHEISPRCFRVTYPLPDQPPLVSIVIPTRDRLELLKGCVESVMDKTNYKNFEIIIMDNNSTEPEVLSYLENLKQNNKISVNSFSGPFNYSAINNMAIRQSKGELICLLNNDIKIKSVEWLDEMVSHALRPEVGAVGAKLYFADETIQHAGVILGIRGVAGHVYRLAHADSKNHLGRADLVQNYSAVTAACMVFRRQIFEETRGFNAKKLAVALNDIDFCLQIRELGYRILWTPYAELYHLESSSRGIEDTPEKSQRFVSEIDYFKKKWDDLLCNDPFYNPNLTLEREDFSFAFPPRIKKVWLRQNAGFLK